MKLTSLQCPVCVEARRLADLQWVVHHTRIDLLLLGVCCQARVNGIGGRGKQQLCVPVIVHTHADDLM